MLENSNEFQGTSFLLALLRKRGAIPLRAKYMIVLEDTCGDEFPAERTDITISPFIRRARGAIWASESNCQGTPSCSRPGSKKPFVVV